MVGGVSIRNEDGVEKKEDETVFCFMVGVRDRSGIK